MSYLYLALAIFCEVVGTLGLKLSFGFTKPIPSAVTAIGYVAAFYFLSLSLKSLSVGFTYAVWAGAGIILVAVLGAIFLGETFDAPGLLGIFLIVAGVVVINGFSRVDG